MQISSPKKFTLQLWFYLLSSIAGHMLFSQNFSGWNDQQTDQSIVPWKLVALRILF